MGSSQHTAGDPLGPWHPACRSGSSPRTSGRPEAGRPLRRPPKPQLRPRLLCLGHVPNCTCWYSPRPGGTWALALPPKHCSQTASAPCRPASVAKPVSPPSGLISSFASSRHHSQAAPPHVASRGAPGAPAGHFSPWQPQQREALLSQECHEGCRVTAHWSDGPNPRNRPIPDLIPVL